MIHTPPNLPPLDTSALVPPQIVWFDGATGELTGSYPQVLDHVATQSAYQAAWNTEVAAWQAACAALDAANAAATPPITAAPNYPAPPVAPTVAPVWLMDPYHMTAIAPPALQPGMRPVFANGAWTQVEDHRGVPLWDATGAPLPHLNVLGPLPVGALTVQPPLTVAQVAAALAAAKASALAGVIAYADGLDAKVTAVYPKAEQATWPQQLSESTAVIANASAPTPLLARLIAGAAAGGLPTAAQISAVTPAMINAMAQQVVAKAAGLQKIAVAIITLRSNAQTAINAAPDLTTLGATVAAIETQAAAAATALGL